MRPLAILALLLLAASPAVAQVVPGATVTIGSVTNNAGGTAGQVQINDGSNAFAAYAGTSCTNQFPRSLNASGAATCASVGTNDIAANAVTLAKLATQADSTILSNISGGAAVPSANTITATLDKLLGTTQGSVIYRDAAAWASLAPDTSGKVLQTKGAAANPAWSAVVLSLAGTANQITASASTGAITLSLPAALTVPGSLTVTTRTGTPAAFACFDSGGVLVSSATACQ